MFAYRAADLAWISPQEFELRVFTIIADPDSLGPGTFARIRIRNYSYGSGYSKK